MSRLTPKFILSALAVPLAALAVTGCGGNSSTSGAGGNASVNVAKTGLGNVLVDAQGRTLYLFSKDAGSMSSCFGACATNWPPARVANTPTVSDGLTMSKATTTGRSDGQPELTYNGHPLYRFEGDHKPGDTSGQGLTAFGGKWYAVSANGDQASATTSSTSSGGGY